MSTRLGQMANPRKGLSIVRDTTPTGATHDADGWFYPSSPPLGTETIDAGFDSYVQNAYKANGIVFACVLARMLPFAEVRFQYQQMATGRPGKLFGNAGLELLEEPWPNGTTGELLARMEQDGSLAGNFFAVKVGDGTGIGQGPQRIRRLWPGWVSIISGVRGDPEADGWDLEAEPLLYVYAPHGRLDRAVGLTPAQVVHWTPIPDPQAQWRGMSWLTPILREVQADSYATKHKLRFFEKGASLSVVIKYDKEKSPEELRRYKALFDEQYAGVENAYGALHIGGGADPSIIGTDLKSIDFKAVQGAGETRIAAAAGVGAIMARFSEGLAGSSLNQGNYEAAKRQFADMTIRPNWRTASAALAKFANVPVDARLWFDVNGVQFLKEDRKAGAEILSLNAQTIAALVREGYTPDSVRDAVDVGDLTLLQHTGLFSVQLQTAGATADPAASGGIA